MSTGISDWWPLPMVVICLDNKMSNCHSDPKAPSLHWKEFWRAETTSRAQSHWWVKYAHALHSRVLVKTILLLKSVGAIGIFVLNWLRGWYCEHLCQEDKKFNFKKESSDRVDNQNFSSLLFKIFLSISPFQTVSDDVGLEVLALLAIVKKITI